MRHEPPQVSRNLRIVVAGYINLNVIDGSAFFISGLSAMLAENPFIDVYVVTANPIERSEVLDELTCYPNLKIIDPFRPNELCYLPEKSGTRALTRAEYAQAIYTVYQNTSADALILRDTLTACEYTNQAGADEHNLVTYVTGLTALDSEPDDEILNALRNLERCGSRFLCQTPHIQEQLNRLLQGKAESAILPPHVPDPVIAADEIPSHTHRAQRFVYTGKFFAAWNVVEIFSAFKAVNRQGYNLHLDVAGDQFRPDPNDDYFVSNVKYLLSSTPGLTWHGRVPRSESRSLIASSDVGIGWRAATLNSSSEFSTKILEYGAMGKPAILNPTPVNVSILGADYPLYAESRDDFESLLRSLDTEPELLQEAASRCFSVAEAHSYSRVRPELVEFLVENLPIHKALTQSPFLSTSLALTDIDAIPRRTSDSHAMVLGETVYVLRTPTGNANEEVDLRAIKEKLLIHKSVTEQLRNKKPIYSSLIEKSQSSHKVPTSVPPRDTTNDAPISTVELQKRFDSETAQLRSKLESTEARLEALRSSKLGSIQVRIWERHSITSLPKDGKDTALNRVVSKAISTLDPLFRRVSGR